MNKSLNWLKNSFIEFTATLKEEPQKRRFVRAKRSKQLPSLKKQNSMPCGTKEVPVHFDGTNKKNYEQQWHKIIIAHLNEQHENKKNEKNKNI